MEKTGEGMESPANEALDEQGGQRECSSRLWHVVTAVCLTGLAVVIGLLLWSRVQEAARSSMAKKNLEELGLVFNTYRGEDPNELFPPVSPYPGVWAPDLQVLYPKYLHDPSILINPLNKGPETVENLKAALERGDFERAARIAARHYTYIGWTVREEKDIEIIRDVLPTLSRDGLGREIEAEGHTVYRLREGIERFFVTDIMNAFAPIEESSKIPTAFENVAVAELNRKPAGCNVLFLDGHIEYIPLDAGRFPVVPIVADTFPAPEVEP